MHENVFKKRLLENDELYGMFLNIPNSILIEIMHLAGLDFVIIDAQHAPFNPESIDECIRVAHYCGIAPLVRVHRNSGVYIQRAMDLLPAGIIIPEVESAEQAKQAIRKAYFHPKGIRGLSPNTRFAGYSAYNTPQLTKETNENACLICQLEGVEAIIKMDEILEIEGIDGIYIGPYDLSMSMGHPGDVENPEVEEQMMKIVTKAKTKGKTVGTFCQNLRMAKKWQEMGINFLTIGVDAAIIFSTLRDFVKSMKTG
jgi:4-hydroxy-2-oxoheptanedioate aldolase